jgi:hypothetical protein
VRETMTACRFAQLIEQSKLCAPRVFASSCSRHRAVTVWRAAAGPPRARQGLRCARPASLPSAAARILTIHAARNVSGQHKEEIDALGGAGGSPSCRCHQRGNHEGSQNAHYVDTVLLHCGKEAA